MISPLVRKMTGSESLQMRLLVGTVALVLSIPLLAVRAGPASAQGLISDLETRVWITGGGGSAFDRGDRARVYFRASRDAYVAVFQIDTDGAVRLVHPRVPDEDHYVRGGRSYRVRFDRSPYWYVGDDPGLGYFFAVASPRPLDFGHFAYSRFGGGWDLGTAAYQVYRDPYVAMDVFVDLLVPGWRNYSYAMDFAEYHVGRRSYDYPRFLCYDCHAFRPYTTWNPYRYQCHSFRLIVHTDPYYYPVTRYRGTRVVYARPPVRSQPRFVFKERAVSEPSAPIFQPASRTRVPGVAGAERRRSTQEAATGGRVAVPASPAAPSSRPRLERRSPRADVDGERPSPPTVRAPRRTEDPSSRPPRSPASPAPQTRPSRPSATPAPQARPSRPSASPAPRTRPSRPSATPEPQTRPSRPSATPAPSSRPSRPSASPAPSRGGAPAPAPREPRRRDPG